MILVAVGTQLPFDRLISAIDAWAGEHPQEQVFAQIGEGGTPPQHCDWAATMSPAAFQEKLDQAELVVAHAGMGTIIGALELAKPIVVMPRRAAWSEHRNDHQLATAEKLSTAGMVRVAQDADGLAELVDQTLAEHRQASHRASGQTLAATASNSLITAVRQFIHTGRISQDLQFAAKSDR